MFTWLEIFKEISNWILQYRGNQKALCEILREIGFEGNLVDEDSNGRKPLEVMDPLTFFGFFHKVKNQEKRTEYLTKLKKRIGLKSPVPTDFDGIPSAQPMQLCYFRFEKERKGFEIDALWDLSEQAVKGELLDETFKIVLSLPGIRIAKLTQGLFWINPEVFYPIDVHQSFLKAKGIKTEVENLQDYLRVINEVKLIFQKPYYEISILAWQSNQKEEDEDLIEEEEYFSVIKSLERSKLSFFIETLRAIVDKFKITIDDKRVVFSCKQNTLHFLVGQRYCLDLRNQKGKFSFGIISKNIINDTSVKFDGSPVAYYTRFGEIFEVSKYYDTICEKVLEELERTDSSGFKKNDDINFRNVVFNSTSKNIGMLSKEIIVEAIDLCNLIYKGIADKLQKPVNLTTFSRSKLTTSKLLIFQRVFPS